MSKFASFLGRKTQAAASPPPGAPAAPHSAATGLPENNVIEIDQELFFPIATQLGEDNETVRNLLIDAEHKISELETIKRSIGNLVDPVSKTLRAYEETKNQKIGLQTQLNSTRIAYNKQREALNIAEQRVGALEAERSQVRELLTIAQQRVATLEGSSAEQIAELNTRRAQIVDLQRVLQQLTGDLQNARDDNQRLSERVAGAEKRVVKLETECNAAQQKLQLAEKENTAVQAQLDKAHGNGSELSHKLSGTENALALTQRRLTQLETSYSDVQSERARLAAALDDTSSKYQSFVVAQNARFESLQARTTMGEKLLDEARRTISARADEIAAYDRRIAETAMARGAAEARLGEIERAMLDRDAAIKALEQSRAALASQNDALAQELGTRESAYNRAQEKLDAQLELVKLLEDQIKGARQASEMQIEELSAQLQREQLDRIMAEGALEAGRRDIARLLRELTAAQYTPPPFANDAAAAAPVPAKRVPSAA